MLNKPKISVIIPVYNVEKFLCRCLDSVLNQTFADWEAICINDGSPDNSEKILSEYAARDKRFKIINKDNGGPSDARNCGMSIANGEYVLFLDSDDFIHPQTLEITYLIAEKNDADMVSFQYDVKFHKHLTKLLNHEHNISGLLPSKRNIIYNVNKIKTYCTDNVLFHSTERKRTFFVKRPVRRHCFPVLALYRRSLIQDISFIRGIIIEDFPWWSEVLLKRPKTIMINTPLYFYMPNPKSILNSLKSLRIIKSLSVGLSYVYKMYKERATEKEFSFYNREFLWPFIIIAMRQRRGLDNQFDIDVAARAMKKLLDMGVLEKAPNLRAWRYRRKIQKFIKNNS